MEFMVYGVFLFDWQAIKEEDKEYAHIKKDLRMEIRDMRQKVGNMN